jgi:hypothetical protein
MGGEKKSKEINMETIQFGASIPQLDRPLPEYNAKILFAFQTIRMQNLHCKSAEAGFHAMTVPFDP